MVEVSETSTPSCLCFAVAIGGALGEEPIAQGRRIAGTDSAPADDYE